MLTPGTRRDLGGPGPQGQALTPRDALAARRGPGCWHSSCKGPPGVAVGHSCPPKAACAQGRGCVPVPPSQLLHQHWDQFAVASTAAPAQHPPRTRRDPHHRGGIAVPRPPTSPSRPPRAAASLWAPSPPRVPGGPHLPGGSESLSNPRPAAALPAVLPAAAHVCPHVPPTRSPLYFGVFRMCTASRHSPATPNPTARPSTCCGDIPVPR